MYRKKFNATKRKLIKDQNQDYMQIWFSGNQTYSIQNSLKKYRNKKLPNANRSDPTILRNESLSIFPSNDTVDVEPANNHLDSSQTK